MAPCHKIIGSNLISQILDFENEISSREKEMNGAEAKIFLDDLNSFHERFVENETKIEITDFNYAYQFDEYLLHRRPYHLKLTQLKAKLAAIVSRYSSTTSAEANQNNQCNQTDQLKVTPDDYRNLQLRIQLQEQKLLINQIESVEINDNMCEVQAQVSYDHVGKLYELFISNQAQIGTQIDETALVDQLTIASQTQRKVIDIQTRLKKIIAEKENARMSKPNNQIHQADKNSDLDSLVKKSDFLIGQMSSLEPEADICADEAKIIFELLASLYQIFVKNEMKIVAQTEDEREISKEMQRYVILMQTKLKENFDRALNQARSTVQGKTQENEDEPRTTELATVNNLIKLFNELLISHQRKLDQYVCENGNATTFSSTTTLDNDNHLEIIRDIQSRIISLQTKQNEMSSALESIRRGERK